VLVAIVAGGAFYGGMNVGKAQAQDQTNSFFASRGFDPNNLPAGGTGTGGTGTGGGGNFFGRGGQNGQGGAGGFANRGAAGTITRVDGNTVTITDNQGQTVTVNIASNAPIVKSVTGTTADLKVGGHILAIGQRSGTNVSATAVQITDQPDGTQGLFPGGFGGAGRGNRGSATPTPAK
jgi:hypothetical protein